MSKEVSGELRKMETALEHSPCSGGVFNSAIKRNTFDHTAPLPSDRTGNLFVPCKNQHGLIIVSVSICQKDTLAKKLESMILVEI